MKPQISVHAKDLQSVNNMLYELTCLRRWSEVTVEGGKYTELGKQALNSMIAYFWAIEAKHEGAYVNLNQFPKLAIYRGFTKVYQCDVPEMNLDAIFELGNVSRDSFQQMIDAEIAKITSEGFRHLLAVDPSCLEASIFKAATKVATLLELEDIKNGISKRDYNLKKKQLEDNISGFSYLPGYKKILSEEYLQVFRDYSQLRNRIRWAKHPNIIKCGVLGHHFDVAVFSYLMSLEVYPSNEDLATHYFFIGIFHDFPERWTGDMPSPIKDSIPGLRQATEEFENRVMEENVYSLLPTYQQTALKAVMLEDEANVHLKKFSKKSDNYLAFIECWRELDSGSRHSYYKTVFNRDYEKKEKLPENFRLLAEVLYRNLFG